MKCNPSNPTWVSWCRMLQRVRQTGNPKDYATYENISVDPEWLKYVNFFRDMGVRPEGMTLDRIDNTKDYCKENCRWATRKEQTRNQRTNIRYEINGVSRCLSEWAEIFGLNHRLVSERYSRGGHRTVEELFRPARPQGGPKRET